MAMTIASEKDTGTGVEAGDIPLRTRTPIPRTQARTRTGALQECRSGIDIPTAAGKGVSGFRGRGMRFVVVSRGGESGRGNKEQRMEMRVMRRERKKMSGQSTRSRNPEPRWTGMVDSVRQMPRRVEKRKHSHLLLEVRNPDPRSITSSPHQDSISKQPKVPSPKMKRAGSMCTTPTTKTFLLVLRRGQRIRHSPNLMAHFAINHLVGRKVGRRRSPSGRGGGF